MNTITLKLTKIGSTTHWDWGNFDYLPDDPRFDELAFSTTLKNDELVGAYKDLIEELGFRFELTA